MGSSRLPPGGNNAIQDEFGHWTSPSCGRQACRSKCTRGECREMRIGRFAGNFVFAMILAALATKLFVPGATAQIAQAPSALTLVKAGHLLDPRTGNVLAPAAVLVEG